MSEESYYSKSAKLDNYYRTDTKMPAPKAERGADPAPDRNGVRSIFNRYSIFFLNEEKSGAYEHGDLLDFHVNGEVRVGDSELLKVRKYPTAENIIEWSRKGTNAAEFAWEDFLWCKRYGQVPNNYMVTLRRFSVPTEDDLFDVNKNMLPDIARMITWVDGETNKWENVGLKWSHGLQWQEKTAEIQAVNASDVQQGYGNEGGVGGPFGQAIKTVSSLTDTSASTATRESNPNVTQNFNPYADQNRVMPPIDVINKTHIRDRGLEFTQEITLVFEYELRSIDGVNPRAAMIDLLSNVTIATMNRGSFWGGDIRYYGANPRKLKPIGDPKKLASGDYAGYMKSFLDGISNRLSGLSGGKGFSFEGIGSALKGIGGNLVSQLVGGGLDKMGRPGFQMLNSLLVGESIGQWHITVGNPANPIISIGNLILESTDVELNGALGYDDFPTNVKVTCKLKPARPRDRTDIISMFSRNHRTYLTASPKPFTFKNGSPVGNGKNKKHSGNQKKGYRGKKPSNKSQGDTNAFTKQIAENISDFQKSVGGYLESRFPNQKSDIINKYLNSAKGIY